MAVAWAHSIVDLMTLDEILRHIVKIAMCGHSNLKSIRCSIQLDLLVLLSHSGSLNWCSLWHDSMGRLFGFLNTRAVVLNTFSCHLLAHLCCSYSRCFLLPHWLFNCLLVGNLIVLLRFYLARPTPSFSFSHDNLNLRLWLCDNLLLLLLLRDIEAASVIFLAPLIVLLRIH